MTAGREELGAGDDTPGRGVASRAQFFSTVPSDGAPHGCPKRRAARFDPRGCVASGRVGYYVTTPIYYVNGEPHLGHAYTTIAADVLARHMRQRGEDVFFLTGTDEHGEPVAFAAEKLGISPRELADKNAERFKAVSALVNATNDFFIRTSDPRHHAKVQEVLQRVYDAGHVYKGVYEGYYCPRCADFKSEAELMDGNKCPIHLIELEREQEENWFFRLSTFQEPLERMFEERPDWVLPRNRYNEALSFIKQGLNDVSLTRARITWGVPVPWDEGHVFYVWFDALLNYYTALSFAREGEDLTDRFWPATVHVMAKDILKFHTVFWPALLMAADIELPKRDFIHGYLLMDEHKMSKSLGNVVDPFRIVELYGADALRYYVLREVSFGQDGSISTEGFERRYTSELANEYGNLASRTLAMIHKYRDGVGAGRRGARRARRRVRRGARAGHRALRRRRADRRARGDLEPRAPAERVRPGGAAVAARQGRGQAERLDAALYSLAEGLRVVSLLLVPFMPEATDKLLTALGQDDRSLETARFGSGAAAPASSELEPLFPRVEAARRLTWRRSPRHWRWPRPASGGEAEPRDRRLTAGQLAGQRVVAGFRACKPPRDLLRRIRRGKVGGVILFAQNVESRDQVARGAPAAVGAPARAVDEPLLVMVDQEGGPVVRIPGAPGRSAAEIGATGRAAVARRAGRAAGRNLRGAGVNVDLAPVVDVARPGSAMERERRSYGRRPRKVARFATRSRPACRTRRLRHRKHFPGFGAAGANTDNARVTISAPRKRLRAWTSARTARCSARASGW